MNISKINQLLEELRDELSEQLAVPGEDLPEPSKRTIEHERMRIETMSDEALETRLYKITNPMKLYAFAKMLEEYGLDDIAETAWELLRDMGWNKKGKWVGPKK